MEDARPSRRWFRFSLRTLFMLVTVFACWLGWQVKVVQDRKSLLDRADEQRQSIMSIRHYSGPHPTVPFWRRWLGDKAETYVVLPLNSTETELATARRLFPEALDVEIEGVP